MIPVDQTEFGAEKGNCLMACLASIFETTLEGLPILTPADDDGTWWVKVHEVAARFGYSPRIAHFADPTTIAPPGYHLITGNSERGLPHAVVAYNGVVIHDPHPSRAGIADPEFWILLFPIGAK